MRIEVKSLTQEMPSLGDDLGHAISVAKDEPLWVDVEVADVAGLAEVLEELNLSINLPESWEAIKQEPWVQVNDNKVCLAFSHLNRIDATRVERIPVVVVLTPDILVTAQPKGSMATCLANRTTVAGCPTPSTVMCELFEQLVSECTPVCFACRDATSCLSIQIDNDIAQIEFDDVVQLKRRVIEVIDTIQDQGFCLIMLLERIRQTPLLQLIRDDLGTLRDRLERGARMMHLLEQRLRDLQQVFLHGLDDERNSRLKVLTILSAVYMPPTLIAAIYGMNFTHIPILEFKFGYAFVMVLMITLVVGQLFFFYKRGWFK